MLHFSTIGSRFRRSALVVATFTVIFSGVFGIFWQQIAAAYPSQYTCGPGNPSGPQIVMFGRRWGCGYFTNNGHNSVGTGNASFIYPNGLAGVNSVGSFESMVLGGLGNGRMRSGSEFYIFTMLGIQPGNTGMQAAGPSGGQIAQWENLLQGYSNLGENGSVSWGTNGSIQWAQAMFTHCAKSPYLPQDSADSYYYNGDNDVHAYWVPWGQKAFPGDPEFCTGNNVPNGSFPYGGMSWTGASFYGNDGSRYYIDRLCGNTRIATNALDSTPLPNFNLTPTVNAIVNGADQGNDSTYIAEPGDNVQFVYRINNSGGTQYYTCVNTSSEDYLFGSYQSGGQPATAPGGGSGPGPVNGCNTYGSGSSTLTTENFGAIPASDNGQTICRWLGVSPASFGGPPAGSLTCVFVASKPYFKVYGGDVSVGQGLVTSAGTCTTNTASNDVVAWNQNTGSYSGSGTQFAAYAMNVLTEFATDQGNSGGGASPPAGLSFTNTAANVGSGNYGGGSNPAVPCIPDYYSRKRTSNFTTISSGTQDISPYNGVYESTPGTNFTIKKGNVTPGQQVTIYVDGNVYIAGNIIYSGGWSISKIPMFELVVKGNIYIDPSVSELDGIYIAQQDPTNPGTTGTIYTCASNSSGYAPVALNGSLYSTCNQKLTFNGAVVANSVQLLRTLGNLQQSGADGGGTDDAAEVFNYNPAVWLVPPADTSGVTGNYDAISSLPPVL